METGIIFSGVRLYWDGSSGFILYVGGMWFFLSTACPEWDSRQSVTFPTPDLPPYLGEVKWRIFTNYCKVRLISLTNTQSPPYSLLVFWLALRMWTLARSDFLACAGCFFTFISQSDLFIGPLIIIMDFQSGTCPSLHFLMLTGLANSRGIISMYQIIVDFIIFISQF